MFSLGFEIGGFQATLREMASFFFTFQAFMGLSCFYSIYWNHYHECDVWKYSGSYWKKRILLKFISLFIVGTTIVGISSSLTATVIGIFLIGCGYGVSESVSTALLSDHYTSTAHQYINLSQAFLCLGAVLAPLLSAIFFSTHMILTFLLCIMIGLCYGPI